MRRQSALDLTQFDTITACLNHVVAASQELVIATGQQPDAVARAVTKSGMAAWIRPERSGRPFGIVPVSTHEIASIGPKRPLQSLANLPPLVVQYESLQMLAGTANGNRSRGVV